MTEVNNDTWNAHQHLTEVSARFGIQYAGATYDRENRVRGLHLPAGGAVEAIFTAISQRMDQRERELLDNPRRHGPRQAMRVKTLGHHETVLLTVTAPDQKAAAGVLTDLLPVGTAIGYGHDAHGELGPGAPLGRPRTHRDH